MKKKMVTVLLTAAMVTAMAAGCGSSSGSESDKKESYTIGIEQFAEHGSLDNCREGFLKGLEAEGIKEGDNLTVKYKNAAADMGTAKQISDSLVSDKVDLVCAIATPSAQSAYNAAMKADIPVIYTAVTDPVAAELADKDGKPVGEVTGTSDKLPVEEQLKMIREMLPDAKKIGIMYTTSEANSVSAIKEYKSLVKKYGFELLEKGITTTADAKGAQGTPLHSLARQPCATSAATGAIGFTHVNGSRFVSAALRREGHAPPLQLFMISPTASHTAAYRGIRPACGRYPCGTHWRRPLRTGSRTARKCAARCRPCRAAGFCAALFGNMGFPFCIGWEQRTLTLRRKG